MGPKRLEMREVKLKYQIRRQACARLSQQEIWIPIGVEINRVDQYPADRKCGTERAPNKRSVIQKPDCCLSRARIKENVVGMRIMIDIHGCNKDQPAGRVGPKALLKKVALLRNQTAVRRVLGLKRT